MKKAYLKILQHCFFHLITIIGGLLSLVGTALIIWELTGNTSILVGASDSISKMINASAGALAIYSGALIMSISRFIVKNLPD